jgi:hypothetical protein
MGRSIEPSTLEVGKFFRKFTQVIMGFVDRNQLLPCSGGKIK